jgi:hypothetical protein
MNAWYSRVDKPDKPDFVLFDLDPPDGGFELAIEVAQLIRELLDEVQLPGYVKTSGRGRHSRRGADRSPRDVRADVLHSRRARRGCSSSGIPARSRPSG